jgi:multidrug resistance efflux pump
VFTLVWANVPAAGQQFVAAAPGRVEGHSDVMPLGLAGVGVVEELLVSEGERVEKNRVLLRLNCRPLVHEIAGQQAHLAAAESILARLINGPRPAEIATAEANVLIARARAEEARLAHERLARLTEGHSVTVAEMARAARDKSATAGAANVAREQLALLREGTRQEEIAEAKARVAAARELIAQTRARLDQCSIRAPSSGIVLITNVTVGQFISSNVPMALITMVDDSSLKVRAEIDERDLSFLCMGQRAAITADGQPGRVVAGTISALMPRMGRRRVLSGDPAEKSDRDVREVLISMRTPFPDWPIGLRVVARLEKCARENEQLEKPMAGSPATLSTKSMGE